MGFDIKRFEVLVEPRDHYINGDRVNCMLIIDLIGVLKSKYVYMTAIGEVFAKFHKNQEMNRKTNLMSISFNFGQLVGFNAIKTGVYRIPFSFVLINATLPTLKDQNGSIRYYVQAIIEKQLSSDSFYSTTVDFIVKTNSYSYPLNMSNTPVSLNCEKIIRALGLKIGTIRLSAHLDKNKFISGEIIHISFHMDNRSPKIIRFIGHLNQKTTFLYEYISLDSQKTLMISHTDYFSNNSSTSGVLSLIIPKNCVPTLGNSAIEINYKINFFVDISGCFENFQSIPIFIY